MYIVIEGIDTSGKSTQLNILKEKYQDAIFTKEPGGTQLGIKIRDIVLNAEASSDIAEMLLFLADRAQHSFEIIKQNKDKMIISDRGLISGIAYANHIDIDTSIYLNKLALHGEFPDKIIFLELQKDELIKRLSNKQNDAIEKRGIDYLLNIQNRMKEIIVKLELNYIFIDASSNIDDISKKISNFIN